MANKLAELNDKIAETVVEGYKKIEDTVVGAYQKVEDSFVGAYQKLEDKMVEQLFSKGEESVGETKARLRGEDGEE